MQRTNRRWLVTLIGAGLVTSATLAKEKTRPAQSASSPSADEAALKGLVSDFFEAHAKEDLEGFTKLWSAKAPDLEARRKTMQELFATHDRFEVKNLTVRKMIVEGERAKVRVAVEISAVEKQAAKPTAELGKMNRALHFVKEESAWKVWREVAAEEDLAAAIVAAKTEQERKALLAAEKDLMTTDLRKSLIALGNRLRMQGNVAQALATYGVAQGVAEEMGDKAGVAQVLNEIGRAHWFKSDFKLAMDCHQKALALSELLGDKREIATALNGIGNVHKRLGSFNQALEFYHKSMALSEATGDTGGVARGLGNIGDIHSQMGEYRLGLEYLQKSLPLYEALGNKGGLGIALNNIGIAYALQGNYTRALEHYQKSLPLKEEMGDRLGIAATLHNIGNMYVTQHNYASALEHYQKALMLFEVVEDKLGVAATLNTIGETQKDLGDYTPALENLGKALSMFEALGEKTGVATALNVVGEIYRAQGNQSLAVEHYRKSLALSEAAGYKKETTDSLRSLASSYYSQGDYSQALQFAERAAALAKKTDYLESLREARTTAGRAYGALNRRAEARKAYEEAIDVIESIRARVAGGEQEQQRFFEAKISPYHGMLELVVAQGKTNEALAYAERVKGRVLLDVLQSGRVNITKAMTAQEQEREQRLRTGLVLLNTQVARERQGKRPDEPHLKDLSSRLEKARHEYESFQTGLYAAHPELKVRRGETQPVSLREAGALLADDKTALAEYVVTDDKTYLFVLTKAHGAGQGGVDLKTFTLPIKQKDLAERTEAFRRQLAQRELDFKESARKLYDLLLAPARTQLQGKTRLVIVPDAALWEMPFQALKIAENRYLIEDHALSYAPSLTVLREMVKKRSKKRNHVRPSEAKLLAFGNPSFGKETVERVQSVHRDEKLAPLPEAEKEVRTVAQLYGAERSKVYVGAEASEGRIKAEADKFAVLHLATHGILNDASPMYSQVVMAQGGEDASEDGLLEAWEIVNLDLKADLMVLSACETARGRVGAGEGMIGLTWALFVAGIPTTVVSQWKVESASTTELMVEFHRQLRSGAPDHPSRVGPAEALRQAVLKQMRSDSYRHPFYWASFVVIGDGS